MSTDDDRLKSHEIAFAIMNGYGCLERVIDGDLSADVIAGLDSLEPALTEFMRLRDGGATAGGPHAITDDHIARLRRLRELGRDAPTSADIQRLARALLAPVGGL
jgi:hypothetical protein